MYTVKRAVIMAAGKGHRMGVLTQDTPSRCFGSGASA